MVRGAVTLDDVSAATRLVVGVRRLLRHPVTPPRARAMIEERRARRESDFLQTIHRVGECDPAGPYARLLRSAGCEYGDVARLVRLDGVDGTLRTLARHGVYLTVEEFKGRRPVVRGEAVFEVDPGRLRLGRRGPIAAQTSGSRGRRATVAIDMATIRAWAVDACLDYEARGGLDWVHARWTVPGGDSVAFLLLFCAFGATPVRWFSPVDPAEPGLHPRYRWSGRLLPWAAWLGGAGLPHPEHVPLDAPEPVAAWLAAVRRRGRTPHLVTYVSSAVRVCEAALTRDLDIRGARFSVTGEPITAARLAAIQRAGAQAAPYYGSVDAGLIGAGCLAPVAPDEVHVHEDLVTLVQPDRADPATGLRPEHLLVSSFRADSPLVLLNVSLGDEGVLEARRCGCPLEGVGWTGHLHTIRSFEKLTVGGMTLLDCDVVRVLENVLPGRFGGGPTDYQLLEEEAAGGEPRLRLLVHPRVGTLRPDVVADTFLGAIGAENGAERVMALHWQRAGVLRVERVRPLTTDSGKILHLHRRPAAPGSRR
jgi:hypothetical protein